MSKFRFNKNQFEIVHVGRQGVAVNYNSSELILAKL